VFFFQAEDGIRDFHVTGVQTCALPISADSNKNFNSCCSCLGRCPVGPAKRKRSPPTRLTIPRRTESRNAAANASPDKFGLCVKRSEERRVGKESVAWCSQKE